MGTRAIMGFARERRFVQARIASARAVIALCVGVLAALLQGLAGARAQDSTITLTPELRAAVLREIPNPTCSSGNATTLPTDPDTPCIRASNCLAPNGKYTNATKNANCDNWVCSLRINCGCFAGPQTTNCQGSTVRKPGCLLLAQMFEDVGCSWVRYLGARESESDYEDYLNLCLAGCNSAPAAAAASRLAQFLSVLGLVAVALFVV